MKYFEKCKVCGGKLHEVNKTHKLVQCSNCQLVFAKSIFTDQQFIETYDKLYNKTLQYDIHQKEYQKLAKGEVSIGRLKKDLLHRVLKNNVKNLCEVGAGVGLVASYLQNSNVNYLGIELDEKTSSNARKIGFNIKTGAFNLLEEIDQTFDGIVAFEVIEHLQDVDLFFKLVSEKLNPKGVLGFSVPNYDKRLNYKNAGDNIYQSGPPIHLNYFTKESIRNIAKIYNFEVSYLEVKRFPYLNLKKVQTYTSILKSIFGMYHGSTIKCVLVKK